MEPQKTGTFQRFSPTFKRSIFESGLFRQSQRFALPALGQGRRSRPARKMLRRRKLIEIRTESPASGARFVGRACYRNYEIDYSRKIKRGHDLERGQGK